MFDNQKSETGHGAVIMQGTDDWNLEADYGQSQYTIAVGPKVTVIHAAASVANAHHAYFFKTPTLPANTDLTDWTQNLFDMLDQNKDEIRNVVELIKTVAKEENLEPVNAIAPSENGDVDLSTSVELHLLALGSAEALNDKKEELNIKFLYNMMFNKLLNPKFIADLKIA